MKKIRTVPQKVRQAYQLACRTQSKAHAPYSNFHIGSSVISKSGNIFSGCNVENSSFGATICAERNAIASAVAKGHNQFTDLIIVSKGPELVPPCGICRQFFSEFALPNSQVWIGTQDGLFKKDKFFNFYPSAFVEFTPDT